MRETARDIMSPELFSVRPSDTVESARNGILALGITAAPVLDIDRLPLGVVSLRDLSDEPRNENVLRRMTSPVVSVRATDPVDVVAEKLAQTMLRHLVVVDAHGRGIGMVSAGDVLRSLLGAKAKHPPAFPPPKPRETKLYFGDHFRLEVDVVLARAPSTPGIIELSIRHGGAYAPLWIEAAENMRSRLTDILEMPHELSAELRGWIERSLPEMRFRFALVDDPRERTRVLAELQHDLHFGRINGALR